MIWVVKNKKSTSKNLNELNVLVQKTEIPPRWCETLSQTGNDCWGWICKLLNHDRTWYYPHDFVRHKEREKKRQMLLFEVLLPQTESNSTPTVAKTIMIMLVITSQLYLKCCSGTNKTVDWGSCQSNEAENSNTLKKIDNAQPSPAQRLPL